MSIEQQESQQSPEPDKVVETKPRGLKVVNTRTLFTSAAIAVVLLMLTAWAGSIKLEKAQKESLKADVTALASLFKYPLLEANSLRTTAGRERLQPMVDEVAEGGGYVAVSLTDENGEVLASTKPGSVTIERSSEAPWVGREATGLSASAPILIGGNPIGYIFIETDR